MDPVLWDRTVRAGGGAECPGVSADDVNGGGTVFDRVKAPAPFPAETTRFTFEKAYRQGDERLESERAAARRDRHEDPAVAITDIDVAVRNSLAHRIRELRTFIRVPESENQAPGDGGVNPAGRGLDTEARKVLSVQGLTNRINADGRGAEVGRAAVSHWENGRRMPSIGMLLRLAWALETSPGDLLASMDGLAGWGERGNTV